jgi:hypothetical protein
MGPDGNLYVADQQGGTIRKYTFANDTVTTIGGTYSAFGATEGCGADALNGQLGQLTVDASGNVWTCDRDNTGAGTTSRARISKGTPTPGGPIVQINFTVPANYSTCSVLPTLDSSSTVGGPYADAGATITQLGPASWRATVAPSGDAQFYRVKLAY